jgi:hypothetical protein
VKHDQTFVFMIFFSFLYYSFVFCSLVFFSLVWSMLRFLWQFTHIPSFFTHIVHVILYYSFRIAFGSNVRNIIIKRIRLAHRYSYSYLLLLFLFLINFKGQPIESRSNKSYTFTFGSGSFISILYTVYQRSLKCEGMCCMVEISINITIICITFSLTTVKSKLEDLFLREGWNTAIFYLMVNNSQTRNENLDTTRTPRNTNNKLQRVVEKDRNIQKIRWKDIKIT